jgi:hypothetical protein
MTMAADRNAAPRILTSILNLLLERASEYKSAVWIWFPPSGEYENEEAEQDCRGT